jgi:hypothetical protein
LALTSPTGGGRSVGIVRSRTKATEFLLELPAPFGRPNDCLLVRTVTWCAVLCLFRTHRHAETSVVFTFIYLLHLSLQNPVLYRRSVKATSRETETPATRSVLRLKTVLSDNYGLSLCVAISPHVWVVVWVGNVDMINEPSESGHRYLSDKVMTLCIKN